MKSIIIIFLGLLTGMYVGAHILHEKIDVNYQQTNTAVGTL